MGGAALGSPRPSPLAPPLPLALRPPGSQDAPPRLDVAGKSLFLSPHCLQGHLLPLPGPSRAGVVARQLSLGWEQAHPHFLLGKLRPRGVAYPETTGGREGSQTGSKYPPSGGSGERKGGPSGPSFSITQTPASSQC